MKRGIVFLSLCALVLAGIDAVPVHAWHARGHMTVALIAYRQLNEQQQKQVREILKTHPHYKEFLTQQMPPDGKIDEWMVMQAAIWPDWVRTHHAEEFS